MKIWITIGAVFFALALQAQQKIERETLVHRSKVPEDAREWMNDAYEGLKRIKWFEEISEDGRSFEAKLQWKRKRHSVKFDTTGVIIDLEIVISQNELPQRVNEAIQHCLDSTFLKYNILKIQVQYTGAPGDLEDIIDENEMENITTRYEIEFYGKTKDENELWEGLFDHEGRLLKCRVIVVSPADNLNF